MKIVVPPGLRYSCHQCGNCCRGLTVVLLPGERERVESLSWDGLRSELVGARKTRDMTEPGFQGRACLAHRPDDACVFLGEANQCLIHEHFGKAAKPFACRLAPFAFVPIGNRMAVDASFLCPSMGREDSELLSEDSPEWAELLAECPDIEDRRSHSVRSPNVVSADVLLDFQRHILRFLNDQTLPFIIRVRCVMLFLSLAATGDPNNATAGEFREAIAKGIVKQVLFRLSGEGTMDRTQTLLFYQLLYLALNPIRRTFHDLSPASQTKEKQRMTDAGNRFRDRRGNPVVDHVAMDCDFAAVQRVDASYFQSADCTLPELCLSSGIFGQGFLVVGGQELPLVEAVPRFLLFYPMMIWTAKALAAQRKAEEVGPGDVRGAVTLIGAAAHRFHLLKLPEKLQAACAYLQTETDMVTCAINDMMKT